MERITKGEYITLDNDVEYCVVEVVEQEDKHYLYLVNEEETEVAIVEEIIDGDELLVETVDDVDKMREITKIVVERLNKN